MLMDIWDNIFELSNSCLDKADIMLILMNQLTFYFFTSVPSFCSTQIINNNQNNNNENSMASPTVRSYKTL